MSINARARLAYGVDLGTHGPHAGYEDERPAAHGCELVQHGCTGRHWLLIVEGSAQRALDYRGPSRVAPLVVGGDWDGRIAAALAAMGVVLPVFERAPAWFAMLAEASQRGGQ
jgi:hypothetical protein